MLTKNFMQKCILPFTCDQGTQKKLENMSKGKQGKIHNPNNDSPRTKKILFFTSWRLSRQVSPPEGALPLIPPLQHLCPRHLCKARRGGGKTAKWKLHLSLVLWTILGLGDFVSSWMCRFPSMSLVMNKYIDLICASTYVLTPWVYKAGR